MNIPESFRQFPPEQLIAYSHPLHAEQIREQLLINKKQRETEHDRLDSVVIPMLHQRKMMNVFTPRSFPETMEFTVKHLRGDDVVYNKRTIQDLPISALYRFPFKKDKSIFDQLMEWADRLIIQANCYVIIESINEDEIIYLSINEFWLNENKDGIPF